MRADFGVRLGRLVLLALVASVGACDDDDPTGLDPDDLAGTWLATGAVMINVANTSQTEDLIAQGMLFRMTIRSDGTITTSIDIGFGTEVDEGTWSISGNELSMVIEGEPVGGTVSRDGNRMELSLSSGLEWDFDGTGLDVPAILDLVMIRQ